MIDNNVKEAEYNLMDKNYRDFFSDDSNKTMEEIAEYNFEKENFENTYGVSYVDFAQRNIDEDYDGQTIKGMAKVKDVAYSVGGNLIDFVQEMGEIGFNAAYGATTYAMTGEWGEASDEEKKDTWVNPEKAYESQTTEGAIAGGIAKGVAGLATGTNLLRGAKITGEAGKLTKLAYDAFGKTKVGTKFAQAIGPVLEGMAGDGLAFWKDRENLSTMLKKNSKNEIVQQVADYLAIEEDDSSAEIALKQALEGAVTGTFANVVMKGLKYIKSGSKSKQTVNSMMTKLDDVINDSKTRTSIVDTDVAQDIVDEAVATTSIPRDKLAVSYEEEVAKIRNKLVSEGVDPETITTENIRELSMSDTGLFERAVIATDNENRIASAVFDTIKDVSKRLDAGDMTKADAENVLYKAVASMADALGATKDATNEAGRALGLLSKSDAHIAMNRMVEAVVTNPDKTFTKQLINDLANANDSADFVNKMIMLLDTKGASRTKEGLFRNFLRNMATIQQSALLSNPGTLAKNITSNILMGTIDSVEKIPQAMVSKARNVYRTYKGLGADTDIVRFKEVSHNIGGMIDTVKDVFKDFLEKASGNKTKPGTLAKYREDIGGASAYIGKQDPYSDNGLWKITKFLTKYSGRTANDYVDNFFGAAFSRAELNALADNATAKAIAERGLTEEQAAAFRTKYIKDAMGRKPNTSVDLNELKNLDKELMKTLSAGASYDKALQSAKELTLRGGRGATTEAIVKFVQSYPEARLLVPFLSTTSNMVIDRGLADRTIFGLFSSRVRANLAKGGREADKIIGRQIVGNSLLFSIASMADDFITGNWSSDPKVRQVQAAAGFQPYSIKMGDTYYSYKESALGSVIAVAANIRDAIDTRKVREDDSDLLNYLIYSGQTAADYAFNETSASFIKDLVKFSESKSPVLQERLISGLTSLSTSFIPRWVSGFSGDEEDGYKIRQKQDTLWEKIQVKLGQDTEPILDCFGEPLEGSSTWLGLAKKKMPGGDLNDKLMEIGAGFDAPSRTEMIDGLTLELSQEDTQTVIKEMKNIGLQDMLLEQLNSEEFAMLDYVEELTDEGKNKKKKEALSRTYNEIKRQAIHNLIDNDAEFSKLKEDAIERKIKKMGIKPEYTSSTSSIPTFR